MLKSPINMILSKLFIAQLKESVNSSKEVTTLLGEGGL